MNKKFKTSILVRDKMIDHMRRDGIKVDFKKLDDDEFITSLREKIKEEAREVAEEFDREKLVYELADLSEVTQTLANAVGITQEEIVSAQTEKREKVGGFSERWFTNFLEISSENPVIEYYLSRPKKYPEI